SSGIKLFKLWFTVSREEQRKRFKSRRTDPLRQWKLSPIDEASINRFDDYTASRNEMLLTTDTALAPWTVINSNEKKRARLGSLHAILNAISYEGKNDLVANEPDARVVRPAGSLSIEG
ncbi:MAG: polyphosphate kinase 2, partial [Actinobacteria bacterium]